MEEEVLVLQELNEANKDLAWLSENYSKLQKECSNKFVAIKNRKLMTSASKLESLLKTLKEHKEDPANFLIDFIYAEEETLVI